MIRSVSRLVLTVATLLAGVLALAQAPEEGKPRRTGPAPPTMPVTDAMLERGRSIYSTQCVACHGAAGEGLVWVATVRR